MVYEEVRQDPFPTLGDNVKTTIRKDLTLIPCNSSRIYTDYWMNTFKKSEQAFINATSLCLNDSSGLD